MKFEIGYEDDKIFLMNIDEYKFYKNRIPSLKTYWWLRSPGYYQNYAANVYGDGSVNYLGDFVYFGPYCIRPVIKLLRDLEYSSVDIGSKITFHSHRFIIIDFDDDYIYAISISGLWYAHYDKDSNDYEDSYIRKWLNTWFYNDIDVDEVDSFLSITSL